MELKKILSRLFKKNVEPRRIMFTPFNTKEKLKCKCLNVEQFVVNVYSKKDDKGQKILCKNCIFEECKKGSFVEVIM